MRIFLLRRGVSAITAVLLNVSSSFAAPPDVESTRVAVQAVNAFGLDLFRQVAKPDANALISPYSIQSAMAMAYAGADGKTREEMARVLHYPGNDRRLHGSFANLRTALVRLVEQSEVAAASAKRWNPNAKCDPITLSIANCLFGQSGFGFNPTYLKLLQQDYAAPLQQVDFTRASTVASRQINEWVSERTKQRIREVTSPGAVNEFTRLVLVNAIYLKAAWEEPFENSATKPDSFFVNGRTRTGVPFMRRRDEMAYAQGRGYSVLGLNYSGGQLGFLIFLPERPEGLAAVEKNLLPAALTENLKWEERDVTLWLPKFKLNPPLLSLAAVLQSLGIKSAFNNPPGSANFRYIAATASDDGLFLSGVFHKTFLNLDEQGTEAAAASMMAVAAGVHEPKKPVDFKVDHPFLFAIQHHASGACLFLGHVTDPR